MNKKMKISYETMGSSSYVSITCPPELDLVHYQLEMLLSNKIKNLLAVSKQFVDGEIVIYYNITSLLPLSQVLEKRKIKRNELHNLIEGIVQAVQDASAYRLPAEGILLNPEYIYVNPASCKPSFLYFPADQEYEWDVKELVAHLIMHDQIEMANDNLIQVLLQELNREPFSLESLEKSLKQQGNSLNFTENRNRDEYRQGENSSAGRVNLSAESREVRQPGNKEGWQEKPDKERITREKNFTVQKPSIKESAELKTVEEEAEDKGSPEEFDPARAKKLFMLPQAVIMVIIAASISFGLFTDKAGKIAVNNILALVILIAVAEVILYREVFIHAKQAGKKKGKKPEKQKKDDKQKKSNKTEKSNRPDNSRRPVPPRPSRPADSENIQPVQPVQSPQVLEEIYIREPKQVQPVFDDESDTDIGSETELWDGTMEEGMEAYLEYYEGSHVIRIPISSTDSTIIGRLESQVDFAVKNPKVGKVHAKFYGRNNQYFVVDINSKNGTYINGSRTRIESNSPFLLHDQDRITLADTEFIIRCAKG